MRNTMPFKSIDISASHADIAQSAAITSSLTAVVFELNGNRYAMRLSQIIRVVRAVEISPLPAAPRGVLGVIDFAGNIIPVLDIRNKFRLQPRVLHPSDHFIIARRQKTTVALVVDRAIGTIEAAPADQLNVGHLLGDPALISGIVQIDDGIILIHNLDNFLSTDEAQMLDDALKESANAI
jgi:purine-binding chemotaxis protein CheW